VKVVPGDLDDPRIVELLRIHLSTAHANTAPGSEHALDTNRLRAPDIEFWSLWDGEELLGIAVLKEISPDHGEVKSMHVTELKRRTGAGGTLLRHILARAVAKGMRRLSLETGSWDYFRPARVFYRRYGFAECAPFGEYKSDRNSVFMSLNLH
jgi:putative acetyltransferase